jgi:hypothetical protein
VVLLVNSELQDVVLLTVDFFVPLPVQPHLVNSLMLPPLVSFPVCFSVRPHLATLFGLDVWKQPLPVTLSVSSLVPSLLIEFPLFDLDYRQLIFVVFGYGFDEGFDHCLLLL